MTEFHPITSKDNFHHMQDEFYDSLTAPLDGMWDDIIHKSGKYAIFNDDTLIGYYCINEEKTLLNYYIQEEHLNLSQDIFNEVLRNSNAASCIVSTNNPVFLCASMLYSKKTEVHSYLFQELKTLDQDIFNEVAEESEFGLAVADDMEELIEFYAGNTPFEKDWLTNYLNPLINEEELYYLKHDQKIIGICEVRENCNQMGYADLGVIISDKYRKQGLGEYMLRKAKEISYDQNLEAICSCEKDNVASKKMIEKAGFGCKNLILKISF